MYVHENDVRDGALDQPERGTPVASAEESSQVEPQASAVTPYPQSWP